MIDNNLVSSAFSLRRTPATAWAGRVALGLAVERCIPHSPNEKTSNRYERNRAGGTVPSGNYRDYQVRKEKAKYRCRGRTDPTTATIVIVTGIFKS